MKIFGHVSLHVADARLRLPDLMLTLDSVERPIPQPVANPLVNLGRTERRPQIVDQRSAPRHRIPHRSAQG